MPKITIKTIRKLNPWIKTNAQARKIIKDYHTKPKAVLLLTEQKQVYLAGGY